MSLKASWWEEKRSAYLYQILAAKEKHPLRKNLFINLATAAEDQALVWEKKIKSTGDKSSLTFTPNARTKLVAWLISHFGIEKFRYILSAMKVRGMSVFGEHKHEQLHRGINTAGNLRAAVFGMNDGLISNISLILGVAGANAQHEFIILAGVAGLLAGACSMAAGEYVSVRSQTEVFKYQIELERDELKLYPEEEMEELALIYEARGIPKNEAIKLAELLIKNPDTALDTLAREELGLNPDELGSPIGAMISSFVSFGIGAFIPIIPFLFPGNGVNLLTSILLTAFSLFIIGAVLSLYTNQSSIKGGLRMLLIGFTAGLLTFLIGKWIGISLH